MRTFKIFITAFFLLCSVSLAYAQSQALVTFKAPEGIEITSESAANVALEYVTMYVQTAGEYVVILNIRACTINCVRENKTGEQPME